MGLLSKVFSNARKPEGWLGRMMVNGMNGGTHAAMATWGIGMAGVPDDGDILDIGCGGGANIGECRCHCRRPMQRTGGKR